MTAETIRKNQIQYELNRSRIAASGTDLIFVCSDTETCETVQIEAHKILFLNLSQFLRKFIVNAHLDLPYEKVAISIDSFGANIVRKLIECVYEGKTYVNEFETVQLEELCDVLKLKLPNYDSCKGSFNIMDSDRDNGRLHQSTNKRLKTNMKSGTHSEPMDENSLQEFQSCIIEKISEYNSMPPISKPKYESNEITTEKCYDYCVYVSREDNRCVPCPNGKSCGECEFVARHRRSLTAHMLVAHDMTKMFKCNICNSDYYITNDINCFKLHMNSRHFNIRYQCEQCYFSSNTRLGLDRHKRVIHDKVKKYSCNFCNYSAGQKQQLAIHTESNHYMKQLTQISIRD